MQIAGTIILSIIVLQMLLYLYTTLLRARNAEQVQELQVQWFQQQIALAEAQRVEKQQAKLGWNGYRKFVVDKVLVEAENIRSYLLTPHDGKKIPGYIPGQYLTFRVSIPNISQPVVRCYSISDGLQSDHYRITVKKVPAPPKQPELPPGLVSSFFHDQVHQGDILDVQAPRGHFVMNLQDKRPLVMIAGGVGITPLYSMISSLVENQSDREVHLFYGVRHSAEHAFRGVLQEIHNDPGNRVSIYNLYSEPLPQDQIDVHYDQAGFISIDDVVNKLDSSNYQYYLCGPPPMMTILLDGLKKHRVPKQDIHTEAFTSSTVKSKQQPSHTGKKCRVTFEKSGKTAEWDEDCSTLLEFGEAQNIRMPHACRSGSCGECTVAIRSGNVEYISESVAATEEGSCLTCVTIPDGELVLDV